MTFLTRLTEILAWGGSSFYFSEPKEDEVPTQSEKIEQGIKKVEEEEEEEASSSDDDDTEEAAVTNAAEIEVLKKVASKDRKKYERIKAVRKLRNEQDFLQEVVLTEKQSDDVKVTAIMFIKDQDFLKKIALSGKPIAHKAAEQVEDQEFLAEFALEHGDAGVLRKVKDPKAVTKALIAFPELRRGWWNPSIMRKIKDDKLLKEIVDVLDDKDVNRFLRSLALQIKDKKLLKELGVKLLTMEEYDYYHSNDVSPTSVVLHKLRDKELAKKVLDGKSMSNNVKEMALEIIDEPGAYKKYALEAEGEHIMPEFILKKLDQDFLKKRAESGAKGSERYLPFVKDQAFLKKKFEETKDPRALQGIEDQEFLKKHLKEVKYNDKVLKKIKDQDFLKELLTSLLKERKTKNLPAVQQDRHRRNRSSDDTESARVALIQAIDDEEFIKKVYKADTKSAVREAAFKKITNPDSLLEMLVRERTLGGRHTLVWKLRKHPEYIANYLLEHYTDDTTAAYASKKLDAATSKKILEGNLTGNNIRAIDPDALIEHFKDDQKYLSKILKSNKGFQAWKDAALGYITDEDVLMQFLGAPGIDHSHLDKIKNPKYLMDIVLNNHVSHGYIASGALDKLSGAPAEFWLQLVTTSKLAESLRRRALFYIKDEEVFKNLLLSGSDLGMSILPMFKDDTATLEKALLKGDDKVRKNLAGRIKNQKVLKTFLLQETNDEILAPAAARVDDPAFQKTLAKNSKSYTLFTAALRGLAKNGNEKEVVDAIKHRSKQGFISTLNGNMNLSVVLDAWSGLFTEKDYVEMLQDGNPGYETEILAKRVSHFNLISDAAAFKLIKSFDARNSEYGKYGKYLVPLVKDQLRLYKETSSPEVQAEILVNFKPEDLEAGMVASFIRTLEGHRNTDAISQLLKDQAYKLGSAEEKEQLKEYASDAALTKEHKDTRDLEGGAERNPYRKAQYSREHNKPKTIPQKVQQNPKEELLRALVRLARPA